MKILSIFFAVAISSSVAFAVDTKYSAIVNPMTKTAAQRIKDAKAKMCVTNVLPTPTPTPTPTPNSAAGCVSCAATTSTIATTTAAIQKLVLPISKAERQAQVARELNFYRQYAKVSSVALTPEAVQKKLDSKKQSLATYEGYKQKALDKAKECDNYVSKLEKATAGKALTAEEIESARKFTDDNISYVMSNYYYATPLKPAEVTSRLSLLKRVQTWLGGDHAQPLALNVTESAELKAQAALEKSRLETEAKGYDSSIDSYAKEVKDFEKKLADMKAAPPLASLSEEDQLKIYESNFKDSVTNKSAEDCGLTIAERLALGHYAGSGYSEMNAALRATGTDRATKMETAGPYIEVLNAGLKKLSNYKGYVLRGADLPAKILAQHTVGAIVTYDAYTSTSVSSGFDQSHRFVIKSKTGHYVDPMALVGEEEVLFAPGTKFKVLSREQSGSYVDFVMEEVSQ